MVDDGDKTAHYDPGGLHGHHHVDGERVRERFGRVGAIISQILGLARHFSHLGNGHIDKREQAISQFFRHDPFPGYGVSFGVSTHRPETGGGESGIGFYHAERVFETRRHGAGTGPAAGRPELSIQIEIYRP